MEEPFLMPGTTPNTIDKFQKIFDRNGIPACLSWTVEDVEEWVSDVLNFPQYAECFTTNFINGKKLIHVNASQLPKLGITDFDHIKKISAAVRAQLGIGVEKWDRSISLPQKDTVEHFIERKSHSGNDSKALTFEEHVRYLKTFRQHGVPEGE